LSIAVNASKQSAAHCQRREPYQPGETKAAEHGRRTEVLNPANVHVLLGCDVIGEFLDRGIEEFDGKHHNQDADHADVPSSAGRDKQSERHRHRKKNRFIAQRRLGFKTVGKSTQRILGGVIEPFHD